MEERRDCVDTDDTDAVESPETPDDFERRVREMLEACERFERWEERVTIDAPPSVATLVGQLTERDAERRERARAVVLLAQVPDPEAALALDWFASRDGRPGRLERLAEVARIEWEMRHARPDDDDPAKRAA